MYPLKIIFLYQLLLLAIFFSEPVKIGISKPLPLSTTLLPAITVTETRLEETSSADSVSTTTSSTAATTVATVTSLAKTTSLPESEWPEFPPKKTSKTSQKATTTTKPSTTTIKTSTTTSTLNELDNDTITIDNSLNPNTSLATWPINQSSYCFCDLTQKTCDINCCCDPDCLPEAFKVFRCLRETDIDLETHGERFEVFNFQHGLPSCEVNDGWLCVFRTNQPLVKEESAYYIKDTSRYYKWPNLLMESLEDVKNREFYKFGDLLRIINIETKEIQNFDLPSSFESPFCRIQEPIYHLKPLQRFCLISSYENLKLVQHTLLQLERKYKIFNTPLIPDDIYNNKHLENFVGNITIYKCLESKQFCTRFKENKENFENYTLSKVKVNILHNFTNIQEVVVDLWLQNFNSTSTTKQDEYWLSYEIEFLNKTLKEFKTRANKNIQKPPLIVSGALGYRLGNPLIIARYEPFNKSQPMSNNNQVLNYFSLNNNVSHTLVLLDKENGACKRLLNDRELINYGINVAKHCKIKLENATLVADEPANINFTAVCLNMQQRIHDQLFGPELAIEDISSYFISQLGKPQNISSKWLQLQVYNTHFDAVVGEYLQETNTFVCRNILLSLAYEFHMATLTVDNVPLQKVINHAELHLAERHDLEFSLNENLEVPITMTVRFFDVHEKAASAVLSINFNLIFYLILGLVIFLY